MIANWKQKDLYMDYSSMYQDKHPSDIDLFYVRQDGMIVFGEIKNETYNIDKWKKQRKLYEYLINNIKTNAVYILIVHDKYIEKGDMEVDIPNCYINEYYYKGKWHRPSKAIKVKEVLKI